MLSTNVLTLSIAAASALAIVIRPAGIPEAFWAVLGAAAMVVSALLPPSAALAAVLEGTDVYLFLTGMMVLAELARREGLFAWLAAYAVRHAAGSARRLFLLTYLVGILVTVFLSNDATAVVLTPAVYAAAKHAGARALPYLLVCAFIANAASFVLPISNPANLVVFGSHLPTLSAWLAEFALASVVSIVATYLLLRWTQRAQLVDSISEPATPPPLSNHARITAMAITLTAVALLSASSLGWPLGLSTLVAGCAAWLLIAARKRESPWPVLRPISWSVLPLVAGLFVLVRGVERTGVLDSAVRALSAGLSVAPHTSALVAGVSVALGSNAVNNLPVGLLAATLARSAALGPPVTGALLIGVDLGPNLAITGSLATLLWLVAIRREGEDISALRFLAIGCVVMPPALLATLLTFVARGTW